MLFKALALLLVLPALVACGTVGTPSTHHNGHPDDLLQALNQWSPALATNDTVPADSHPDAYLVKLENPAQAQAQALKQSPAIRAILASQGVADAAYRQATLINNPGFSASALRAENSDSWKTEFGISLGILDWLTLPMRRQLAGAELTLARNQALQSLTDELGGVRSAYFAAVAARHVSRQLQQTAEAARLNAELAGQLYQAGNLAELERLRYEDANATQQQALQQALANADDKLAALKRLLGLGVTEQLVIPDELPDIAESGLMADTLQALLQRDEDFMTLLNQASARRPEVRLLRASRLALQQQLGLQRQQLGMSEIGVGLITEREPDGSRASGFELDLSLPVFDRGQHQQAISKAQLEQLSAQEAALQLEMAHQLKTSLNNLLSLTHQATQLRDADIPRRQRMLELTLQEYNFMLTGPFELIDAKQQELATVVRYIGILEQYWLEHADLMQHTANVAESLVTASDSPAQAQPPAQPDHHQEHHHD